ncbi:hypothetical protein [Cryptosporangium sp. NPDC051539]|uniref:hypothetical protein n=1 Tax=Cryptosporangium sp. NPDC051539 TaxID=3363962 RepID=UPI0037AB6850
MATVGLTAAMTSEHRTAVADPDAETGANDAEGTDAMSARKPTMPALTSTLVDVAVPTIHGGLIEHHTAAHHHECRAAMTPPDLPARRPPTPVIIALGLLVLAPIRLVWFAVEAALDGNWIAAVLSAVFLPVWFLVLRGVWQGGRGAYVVAVVITILQIYAVFGDATSDPDSSKDAAGQLADNWPTLLPAALPIVALLLLVATRQSRAYYART